MVKNQPFNPMAEAFAAAREEQKPGGCHGGKCSTGTCVCGLGVQIKTQAEYFAQVGKKEIKK